MNIILVVGGINGFESNFKIMPDFMVVGLFIGRIAPSSSRLFTVLNAPGQMPSKRKNMPKNNGELAPKPFVQPLKPLELSLERILGIILIC